MLKRFFAMVALALVMVICGTALVACGQQSNNSGSGTQQGETGGGGTGGGNGGGEEEPPVPTYDLFVNNVAGEQVTVKMYLNSLDSTAIFTETGEDDFQKTYSAIEIDKEDKVLAEVGTVAVIFTIENNSQDKDLGVYFWNKADEDATAPTEASISMVNGTEKSDILYGHHYYGEEDLFDLEYEFYNHIPAGETETMHIYVRVTALPDGELKFGMPIYLNIEEYVPTADYDATEYYDETEDEEPYVAFVKLAASDMADYIASQRVMAVSVECDAETGETRVVASTEGYACWGYDESKDLAYATHIVLPYGYDYSISVEPTSENSADFSGLFLLGMDVLKAISLPDSLKDYFFSIESESLTSVVLPEGLVNLVLDDLRSMAAMFSPEYAGMAIGEPEVTQQSFNGLGNTIGTRENAIVGYVAEYLAGFITEDDIDENILGYLFSKATLRLDCPALLSLLLPDSILEVGNYSIFLDNLIWSSEPDYINTYRTEYLTNIGNVVEGVIYLEGAANPFYAAALGIETLEEGDYAITIADGCKVIGYSAFAHNYNDEEYQYAVKIDSTIIIPTSVVAINDFAFLGQDEMNAIVPDSVIYVGIGAFDIIEPGFIYTVATECPDTYLVGSHYFWWGGYEPFETINQIYFYSEEEPQGEGQYWHYVDGVPTTWVTR